jgi:hypothetical protein
VTLWLSKPKSLHVNAPLRCCFSTENMLNHINTHWKIILLQELDPLIFIAVPGSRIRILLFYRGSWIPEPDSFIFIMDPGSRIRILLFLSRILDPRSGSFYFIADPGSRIRILLFYRGSESSYFIADPGSAYFYRESREVLPLWPHKN